VGLAGLLFFELESGDDLLEVPLAQQGTTGQTRPAMKGEQARPTAPRRAANALVATILAQPLFSPTRRPPEIAKSDASLDPTLNDVRLTGIVIEPDRQLAIFAVTGAKPRTLSVGEALNDWKLDSISPEEVSLSGPGGTRTLQPKVDATLVRQAWVPAPSVQPPPTALAGTGTVQPQAAVPPGRVPQPGRAAVQPQVAAPAAPLRVGAPVQPIPRPRPPAPLAPSIPSGSLP